MATLIVHFVVELPDEVTDIDALTLDIDVAKIAVREDGRLIPARVIEYTTVEAF